MIQVLFVCLGNICRSPMAEAIFRDLVQNKGLEEQIKVDSAGTADYHIGKGPHNGTEEILKKYQISNEGLIARQIKHEDLTDFQYIIAMDADNLTNICRLGGASEATKVIKDGVQKDVPDPYYTGNFEETYELVTEGCKHLLERIIQDLQGEEKK